MADLSAEEVDMADLIDLSNNLADLTTGMTWLAWLP